MKAVHVCVCVRVCIDVSSATLEPRAYSLESLGGVLEAQPAVQARLERVLVPLVGLRPHGASDTHTHTHTHHITSQHITSQHIT
jgi:hypothetical protein